MCLVSCIVIVTMLGHDQKVVTMDNNTSRNVFNLLFFAFSVFWQLRKLEIQYHSVEILPLSFSYTTADFSGIGFIQHMQGSHRMYLTGSQFRDVHPLAMYICLAGNRTTHQMRP